MSYATKDFKQSASMLLILCYLVAMSFFVFMRLLGFEYFLAEVPPIEFEVWQQHLISNIFWFLNYIIILRTLTDMSWKRCLLIAIVIRFPLIIVNEFMFLLSANIILIIDIFIMVFIPLCINKTKAQTLKVCALYLLGTLAYQLLFIRYGRGYPEWGTTCSGWLTFSIIDYYVFIWLIYKHKYILHEVVSYVTRLPSFLGRRRKA